MPGQRVGRSRRPGVSLESLSPTPSPRFLGLRFLVSGTETCGEKVGNSLPTFFLSAGQIEGKARGTILCQAQVNVPAADFNRRRDDRKVPGPGLFVAGGPSRSRARNQGAAAVPEISVACGSHQDAAENRNWPAGATYFVQTFLQWLSQSSPRRDLLHLRPQAVRPLFDEELEKVIQRTRDPAHRQILERMRGFNWLSYIAASVRHAGFRDYREGQEKIHDIVVRLLTGTLFRGFDEQRSGPMDLRFKRSVGNAIRNMTELERNRRRLLPTVPIQQEFEPGGVTADDLPAPPPSQEDDHDERLVHDFRRLVRRRLGEIGVAVLDVRLAGGETKSLVGSPALGSPGRYVVKRVVQQVKQLAREYAMSLGDPDLLRRVEKAMADDEETVAKRRTTMAARQAVGA